MKSLLRIDRGDLDGFLGLLIDNLVQLLMIVGLCGLCGIGADSELLLDYILPGAAVSILIGNLFYSWQASRLAKQEGRDDVTALPYGINTPSLIIYIFFVMLPAFNGQQAAGASPKEAAHFAWQVGLIACLGSGLIEFFGSLFAEFIRVKTPRAALLSTLAGIAIGFIAMTFALRMFANPLVALVPLSFLLLSYFSNFQFPYGLPGGFLAVLVGTIFAWVCPLFLPEAIVKPSMSWEAVNDSTQFLGLHLPRYAGETILDLILQPTVWQGYLTVIVPMGLFNLLGSLQNIESAEAAGDKFHTGMSLAANGIGTISAAFLGSCFPTTIYIGHPGWKGLGAKSKYSALNGIVIAAAAFTGCLTLISSIIPLDAGMAIILWIGLIITAQAFQTTPNTHAPAVAMGLFPAIAAWGFTIVQGAFNTAGGTTLLEVLSKEGGVYAANVNDFLIHGLIVLERGYIFTCLLLAAIGAELIERRYFQAAFWSGIAALLTYLGLMHAYQIPFGNVVDFYFHWFEWFGGKEPAEGVFTFNAMGLAASYALFGLVFFVIAFKQRLRELQSEAAHENQESSDEED
ncbi:MAG: NCS2 family permease [Planctomycetaceae bacterium]|nr:NCS2 family permease [Planctomycetaceae bacterium]